MTVSSTDRLQEARAFRVEIGRGTWTDINLIKALMHLDAALGEVSRLDAELGAEREACAAVCESRARSLREGKQHGEANEAGKCARAIRARLDGSPLRPSTPAHPSSSA